MGGQGRARPQACRARVTAKGQQVGAVLCVHAKDMKEPWCLASSERDATAATLINRYARRWTIEPQFRDTKDLRFGMGLSATRVGEPMRRDRLLLISAFATALLTLLGAVGESLGMDRLLKSNTRRTRTHSHPSPHFVAATAGTNAPAFDTASANFSISGEEAVLWHVGDEFVEHAAFGGTASASLRKSLVFPELGYRRNSVRIDSRFNGLCVGARPWQRC